MGAYTVWLQGFAADVDDPVPDLMQLFSISEERAHKLVNAVPVRVKKGADREVAEKFARRLEKIGAEVEVRAAGDSDDVSAGFSDRPPARSQRSVAPSRKRTGGGLLVPASPQMPTFDSPPPGSLPRRSSSSASMPAFADPGAAVASASRPPRRPSSSTMKALNAKPPGPRRRHSSSAMQAIEAPPASSARGSSSPPMEPPAKGNALPRRSSSSRPILVEPDLEPDDDGPDSNPVAEIRSVAPPETEETEEAEEAEEPKRRQRSTQVLGSGAVVRPPMRPAVVGHRSAPPPAPDASLDLGEMPELPQSRSIEGGRFKPATAGIASSRPPPPAGKRPLSEAPPPMPGARSLSSRPPRPITSRPPATTPGSASSGSASSGSASSGSASPGSASSGSASSGSESSGSASSVSLRPPRVQPSEASAPELSADEEYSSSSDIAIAIGVALVGACAVAWRVSIAASIFQGKASWSLGVWVEAVALVLIAAGIRRLVALRGAGANEAFLGPNPIIVAAVFPVTLLANWAISSSNQAREVTGSLDSRLDVMRKIADACERTAKDEASCDDCCETQHVFNQVCECVVPWHCVRGDSSINACKVCCSKEGAPNTRHDLIHNQGCVCNADDSLFADQ